MNLGILAHCYGKLPLEELAVKIGAGGFNSVQLALAKALADVESGLGQLSPGLANYVAESFDRRGVRIAVLGCYINPINPDQAARRYEIDRFKEHLRYARDFGASMVATETGKLTTYQEQNPDGYQQVAWNLLRETVEELAEEAEKWGVMLAIEPATSLVIHDTDGMVRLLAEVPSSNIGVVIDPVNLLEGYNIERQDEVMIDAFSRLGHKTALIHAKDIVMDPNGQKKYAPVIGQGILNYPLFMSLLKKHKPFIDVSLEGLEERHIATSAAFVREQWKKAGSAN
ncbi:sugar phosphate isomerase/epimerase family protein [Paenibacillus thalictri]|uniref:Sugar phosphate isomerase/epimerase n=1 Tax=Paenibacillus thalictri TaxID=2527873 RepID=A0A4Q9DW83_9BACL|nr:sugar phosphate isomerase/epimerase [Paenibacillus thalictri]TBL79978.1 sugar phosphate isomerase/epimerase [Paenibacillus thalictri]